MKEVIKFESIDGQIFGTAKQAEDWDRFVIFRNWYESGNQLTGISAAGASRWLENNQAEVMLFIQQELSTMKNNTPTWKLWVAWAWAIARLDTKQAKRIDDEITRRQPGKPPRNTGNWGG